MHVCIKYHFPLTTTTFTFLIIITAYKHTHDTHGTIIIGGGGVCTLHIILTCILLTFSSDKKRNEKAGNFMEPTSQFLPVHLNSSFAYSLASSSFVRSILIIRIILNNGRRRASERASELVFQIEYYFFSEKKEKKLVDTFSMFLL